MYNQVIIFFPFMRTLRFIFAFFAVNLSFISFSQSPIIIAHRGASAYAPENTLASFEKAIEMGAMVIETDVHQTKDSVVVIMHDLSVDRTTDGKGLIKDISSSDFKKLNVSSSVTLSGVEGLVENKKQSPPNFRRSNTTYQWPL